MACVGSVGATGASVHSSSVMMRFNARACTATVRKTVPLLSCSAVCDVVSCLGDCAERFVSAEGAGVGAEEDEKNYEDQEAFDC